MQYYEWLFAKENVRLLNSYLLVKNSTSLSNKQTFTRERLGIGVPRAFIY